LSPDAAKIRSERSKASDTHDRARAGWPPRFDQSDTLDVHARGAEEEKRWGFGGGKTVEKFKPIRTLFGRVYTYERDSSKPPKIDRPSVFVFVFFLFFFFFWWLSPSSISSFVD
jgi:hypothetical protein